jgi:hypothetical protein
MGAVNAAGSIFGAYDEDADREMCGAATVAPAFAPCPPRLAWSLEPQPATTIAPTMMPAARRAQSGACKPAGELVSLMGAVNAPKV